MRDAASVVAAAFPVLATVALAVVLVAAAAVAAVLTLLSLSRCPCSCHHRHFQPHHRHHRNICYVLLLRYLLILGTYLQVPRHLIVTHFESYPIFRLD